MTAKTKKSKRTQKKTTQPSETLQFELTGADGVRLVAAESGAAKETLSEAERRERDRQTVLKLIEWMREL